MSIEDIILDCDSRGISCLREYLPRDFCSQAAKLVLDNPGLAIIVTGFYISSANAPETDGPPGAIAIGNALEAIGYDVVYLSDRYTVPLLEVSVDSKSKVIDFPITDIEHSKAFAEKLLLDFNPAVIISIERCGQSADGVYRNMRNVDISPHTASLDYLFSNHTCTIGIGDGGNEIGMGNLYSVILSIPNLVQFPSVTNTTSLLISSVSDWGGYGLVAAISMVKGYNLLPSPDDQQKLIMKLVDLGAVDGVSATSSYTVDGFSMEQYCQTLEKLHELVLDEGMMISN